MEQWEHPGTQDMQRWGDQDSMKARDEAMGSQGTPGRQGVEQWEHPGTQDITVMAMTGDNRHQV